MRTKIKVILFDSDGMVVNSEMFSVQYQEKFGVSNNEMLPFFKGEFQDCLIGEADLKKVVKPWLIKWKWQGTVEEFLQFWFKAEHCIDKRIVNIINKLRNSGVVCCLATNQEKYRTDYMRLQMGFNKIFNKVFSSAEIGCKKPSREFFEFILNQIGDIPKNEIMFWDDREENVKAAKDLGLKAKRYTNFKKFREAIEPLL